MQYVETCIEMSSLLRVQECEVRPGRERLLRGEGEGEPDAEDRLDEEGNGDEGELQASDDLRGGHRQGGAAGMRTLHCISSVNYKVTHLLVDWVGLT